jgi:hypothetical protein
VQNAVKYDAGFLTGGPILVFEKLFLKNAKNSDENSDKSLVFNYFPVPRAGGTGLGQ